MDAARVGTGSPGSLSHVSSREPADVVHGAYLGLLDRHRPDGDPGSHLEALEEAAAAERLDAAAARLGRPA